MEGTREEERHFVLTRSEVSYCQHCVMSSFCQIYKNWRGTVVQQQEWVLGIDGMMDSRNLDRIICFCPSYSVSILSEGLSYFCHCPQLSLPLLYRTEISLYLKLACIQTSIARKGLMCNVQVFLRVGLKWGCHLFLIRQEASLHSYSIPYDNQVFLVVPCLEYFF